MFCVLDIPDRGLEAVNRVTVIKDRKNRCGCTYSIPNNIVRVLINDNLLVQVLLNED